MKRSWIDDWSEMIEKPDEYKDGITVIVNATFDFKDRLRILLTGKIEVRGEIFTQEHPGNTLPRFMVRALPILLPWRRPVAFVAEEPE